MALLCTCNTVSEEKIRRLLKRSPKASLLDIQRNTGAATGCGRCGSIVKAFVEKVRQEMPPDAQQTLF